MNKTAGSADSPRMKKLKARRSFSNTVWIVSFIILYLLPKERLSWVLRMFQRYGLERGWRIVSRGEPGTLIGLSIFAFLALLCLFGLVKTIVLSAQIKHEPDNIPAAAPKKAAAPQPRSPAARTRRPDRKTPAMILVIVAVLMIGAALADDELVAPAMGTLAITAVIVIFTLRLTKKKGDEPRPSRTPRYEAPGEEAISCEHRTGKAKYFEQLDSYLKNGLIDREEYKVLKARYEKLDIADDYH